MPSGDLAFVPGYSGGGRAGIAPASLLSDVREAGDPPRVRRLLELVGDVCGLLDLDEAIGSLDVKLSEEEIKQLEEPYKPHLILGHS